jgi:hypothetical protein
MRAGWRGTFVEQFKAAKDGLLGVCRGKKFLPPVLERANAVRHLAPRHRPHAAQSQELIAPLQPTLSAIQLAHCTPSVIERSCSSHRLPTKAPNLPLPPPCQPRHRCRHHPTANTCTSASLSRWLAHGTSAPFGI